MWYFHEFGQGKFMRKHEKNLYMLRLSVLVVYETEGFSETLYLRFDLNSIFQYQALMIW